MELIEGLMGNDKSTTYRCLGQRYEIRGYMTNQHQSRENRGLMSAAVAPVMCLRRQI